MTIRSFPFIAAKITFSPVANMLNVSAYILYCSHRGAAYGELRTFNEALWVHNYIIKLTSSWPEQISEYNQC